MVTAIFAEPACTTFRRGATDCAIADVNTGHMGVRIKRPANLMRVPEYIRIPPNHRIPLGPMGRRTRNGESGALTPNIGSYSCPVGVKHISDGAMVPRTRNQTSAARSPR